MSQIFNRRNPQIVLLFLPFFICSCSSLKVIEKSTKEKPLWLYGIEKDYLTGEGCGYDYNEAKNNALQMVKEKIVSSVAQNISFEQNIEVSEKRYKRAIEFLEEYTSKTTSKSGNRAYLQGISLSKASEFYWEKHRVNRIEKIYYYIKYPFTESDIQNLIKDWEVQEDQLSQRLDTLQLSKNDHNSVESIIAEIEELQYLSSFFVDQRKAVAEISIKNLQNKLNAIQILPITDSLGSFHYQLFLDNHIIKTIQSPQVSSNCAKIEEIITTNDSTLIDYSFDNCSVEEENFVEISYLFEEWNLNHKTTFDVSPKKILIENNSDISFSTVKRSLFKKEHRIKCHFNINSKSPVSFTIDKIELIPELCRSSSEYKKNFKKFPLIIIENINQSFSGKGKHNFTVNVDVSKSKSNKWASRNGSETKISGKIYYSSKVSNESKICEFTDLEYFTNW